MLEKQGKIYPIGGIVVFYYNSDGTPATVRTGEVFIAVK